MNRILLKEVKYEFLKLVRTPRFTFMTIGFPLMFYVLYAVLLYRAQHLGVVQAPSYMLATFGTFGVMGVCLFGVGFNLANERGLGWLELKQASPLPPAIYFASKLIVATIFGLIEVLAMFAIGLFAAGVQMSVLDGVRLVAILVAGCIPFGALGLALGYLTKPDSAPAFLNMIYLPMAFLSGLWMPLEFLPANLQHLAYFMPPFHLSRLALGVLGGDQGHVWPMHWNVLGAFTLVFLGIAKLAYKRSATAHSA